MSHDPGRHKTSRVMMLLTSSAVALFTASLFFSRNAALAATNIASPHATSSDANVKSSSDNSTVDYEKYSRHHGHATEYNNTAKKASKPDTNIAPDPEDVVGKEEGSDDILRLIRDISSKAKGAVKVIKSKDGKKAPEINFSNLQKIAKEVLEKEDKDKLANKFASLVNSTIGGGSNSGSASAEDLFAKLKRDGGKGFEKIIDRFKDDPIFKNFDLDDKVQSTEYDSEYGSEFNYDV